MVLHADSNEEGEDSAKEEGMEKISYCDAATARNVFLQYLEQQADNDLTKQLFKPFHDRAVKKRTSHLKTTQTVRFFSSHDKPLIPSLQAAEQLSQPVITSLCDGDNAVQLTRAFFCNNIPKRPAKHSTILQQNDLTAVPVLSRHHRSPRRIDNSEKSHTFQSQKVFTTSSTMNF
ncbi:unnamed protein product [Natator depressus]